MKLIKKAITYYRYNGLIATIKAVFRKIFKNSINNNSSIEKYKNYDLTISDSEKDNVTLKNGRFVYIFGTVPYYDVGGGQRSSQLAKTFNRMGYAVSYIYAFDSSESKTFYLSMPLCMHRHVSMVDIKELENKIKKDDIFIFEAPVASFEPFLEIAKGKKAKIIYENIDNWETSLGSMFFNENTLKKMLEYSDMVVATAELLVEQTKKYFDKYSLPKKEVYYLANAVDDELFDYRKDYEKPNDIVIGQKTLTYYGSLWGEWFDWDIINEVALSNENISINLIGDYKPIEDRVKKMPKNVHFLGLKKQIELPAYLAYSDYALLPFKPGDISDYVSPLKIFEYISMNKKILATNLKDIIGYPNVFLSNKANDWTNTILNDITDLDNEGRDKFINNNNWNSRCCKMLDNLFIEESKKVSDKFYGNISVVILNYNNLKVITKCIDTLLMNIDRYNYEIVVVDNNSKDGSYELIRDKYSDKITLVRNEKNGCSSGRNLGVANSSKEYILFLDSDQWILHKYWLDKYLEIIDNSSIGVVGWGAGWFNSKGYAYKVVDAYEHRYMPPIGLYRKDIGYLATCGFIMKRELFNKIEGFDLFYDPTCYEDTDLSLKVRNHGLEIVYSPYLGVGHLPHQTTKSGTSGHSTLLQEKGDYFVNKWTKVNPSLINNFKK